MTTSLPRLSVIGLGKLGSPLAAVLASKGFTTVGVDINPAFVDAINEKRAPVEEPLLLDYINLSQDRLRATTDFGDAIANSDISFIIVPTPSKADGFFDNQYILAALKAMAPALKAKNTYHLINITSTVMPGSCAGEIAQAITWLTGKAIGKEIGLCYNPEFIALGNVIPHMLCPDVVLIGECDGTAGDYLEAVYRRVCENEPPFKRMNLVNAELAKISVNSYVTTKISFANMLADICGQLPGADVDVVTDAVGTDSRIGKKYLKGATAFGGPCFPRDSRALAALAESVGAHADLARATQSINDYQSQRLVNLIKNFAAPGDTVAVLGLAYKPDTPVTEESAGVNLVLALLAAGYKITAHDPVAQVPPSLTDHIRHAPAVASACGQADVAVIVTPWPEYQFLGLNALSPPPVLIDCWGMAGAADQEAAALYVRLGRYVSLNSTVLLSQVA